MMYKVDYEDLSQQVYRTLKEMILTGRLSSGEKLRQDALAEELGVSRTPLLSAFSKLEREMLVEIVPRRGAFVKKYSYEELLHVYDIRVRLEPLGAAEAATHGGREAIADLREHCELFRTVAAKDEVTRIKEEDYAFHMRIMAMSGNQLLYNIISSHNIIVVANTMGLLKDPKVSAAEHGKICDAIEKGDSEVAERMMYEHVAHSRRRLADMMRSAGNS